MKGGTVAFPAKLKGGTVALPAKLTKLLRGEMAEKERWKLLVGPDGSWEANVYHFLFSYNYFKAVLCRNSTLFSGHCQDRVGRVLPSPLT